MQALIQLFELPEDKTPTESEHFIEIDPDSGGYQNAYSQLAFAVRTQKDPLKGENLK